MGGRILKGPDYHTPLPEESLGKLFFKSLQEHKGKDAFIDEITNESISYDHLLEITCKLAQAFQNLQLKMDDLIGVYSENSIEYFCPVIAALYLGMTTVPISHYYLEDELTHALTLTKPQILFCSKRNYKQFLTIRNKFDFIKHVVVMDFKEISNGVENFNTFISKFWPKHLDWTNVEPVNLDIGKSIALILFSSGTTGLPKGVMLTHKNYIVRMVHTWDPRLKYYNLNDVSLGIFPFFHASGMMTYTGALLLGSCTTVFWKFDERLFLNAIQKYRLKSFAGVPPLLVFLAKSPLVDEYDLSSLEEIMTGAAPLSEDIENRLQRRLNLKYVRQVYGMTESTLMVTCVPANTWKKGSSGKLVPGMMAAVRDPETGQLLGSHQVGEIVLKGDLIMAGYYKNLEATKEMFLENGFMKTGDLGYYDDEEHFFIVDRLKELIKYKGFQVAPAELESLILKHSKVQDVGVIGVPDEKAGELPLAFVVKQKNSPDLTEEDIVEYVERNVSHQKRLRGGVRFVHEIPKNASGKILRRLLRKMTQQSKSKL